MVNASVFLTARPPDLLSDSQWRLIVSTLGLSNREAEIVAQACYDESVGVMAARLGLSPHSIHTYRQRLYRKLGVDSFCKVMSVVFATHIALEAAKVTARAKGEYGVIVTCS